MERNSNTLSNMCNRTDNTTKFQLSKAVPPQQTSDTPLTRATLSRNK